MVFEQCMGNNMKFNFSKNRAFLITFIRDLQCYYKTDYSYFYKNIFTFNN